MSEKLKRFTDLMQEIFELDKSDLDFGIYRIMNIRKTEIEKFLNDRLPELVQETLEPFAHGNKEEIRAEMAQIEKSASDMGMAVDDLSETAPSKQKYIQLRKQLAEGTDLSALETDVYSALYSFFNRYYEEGDFISKRRYKEGVYAIPYEGEEVKLYWANQDQYYIKTSENFKDYSFTVGDYTVHFRLVDATTEQNNNKESKDKKRVFMLFTEDEENHPGIKTFEYNEDAKEFIIRFIYDIQTKYTGKMDSIAKKWQEDNYNAISDYFFHNRVPIWQDILLKNIPSGKSGKLIDLLEKHLKGYVAKNTFDYFIHKDLRGFLSRELDFYIKSEVMHLDDLDTDHEERVETYLAKVKAIKRVGKIIIDFLAQIEDFQKKLWLKKKFVVETNWCMTLDKVDESFWQEIIENKEQINEWIALYAIDEAEGWTTPPSVDFLRQNQNLMIDTKHFDTAFKERLVASIENLDNQTNGFMLNSENFQALNFITETYQNRIDMTYIDPPYNAKSSEILYKNTYKHSSWLSLMNNRLESSRVLLADKFVFVIAIDENEQEVLGQIINDIFPELKKACITIVHNPRGQQGRNISYTNEFAFFVYPNDSEKYLSDVKKAEIDSRNLRDSGTESDRTDAATCFYPIIIRDRIIIGIGEVPPDDYHPSGANVELEDGTIEIWPIDESGKEKKWRYSVSSVNAILSKLEVKQGRNYLQIILNQDLGTMRSTWVDAKYDASEYGTKLLQHLFGADYVIKYAPDLYPKSLYTEKECISIGQNGNVNAITLDYFSGSGTTGHAVVSLNRDDNGNRKYILVEMGEYFDSVTKPRMQKVVYSADWKDGKPLNRNTGVSQIIKYMTLESYEDALSNIQLDDDTHGMLGLFSDDYMIHYMLDLESSGSLLNLDAFRDPFSYRMKITEKNECKERPVDVIETFNYLIGLTVTHQGATVSFTTKANAGGDYEGAVNLLKDAFGQYSFRQIEGTLPDGRRALVIWRTVSDNIIESNAALDAYFEKYRINPADREYDIIFVNGDNNLENLRSGEEAWKVQMTELEFKSRMFEEV